MIVLIFLFLPIMNDAFDVTKSEEPPTIKPINDSFALVNYQEAFNIKDFSKVTKIEFFNQEKTREGSEYFALASREYDHKWIDDNNRVIQPLEEGADLLATLNPCKIYNQLYVRINGETSVGHIDSKQFHYKPDEICEIESHSWICYEEDSVTLSLDKSEIFHVRKEKIN